MFPLPTTAETTLIMKQVFSTSQEKLFAAWTNPVEIKEWFAPGDGEIPFAEIDLKVGGKYRIGIKDHTSNRMYVATGAYREIHPAERLVFTWMWEGDPTFGETLVTVEFRRKEMDTEMLLIHELFQSVKARDDHKHGWNACFSKLAKVL